MTPDVNVLVAASRSDHVHHAPALQWLNAALADAARGTAPLRLQPLVIASFLRLVTNPKVFKNPTRIEVALKFMDALLGSPGVEQPALGGEWGELRKLCLDHGLAANAIPDAWLAATVLQQGEHLASFDADFRKLLPRSRLTMLRP